MDTIEIETPQPMRQAGADHAPAAGHAPSPAAQAPARVYVHPTLGATFITGVDTSHTPVCRHDVVIILGLHAGAAFDLTVEGEVMRGNAMALRPSTRHALRSLGLPQVKLVVPLIHPRFNAVRRGLQHDATRLDRSAFAHLDARFADACFGHLSADQCALLMEDLLDVLLAGSAPPKPLDPRIGHVLRALAVNIDHPFEALAAELKLSPSRLSHLFAEQLGLSMRGCQAWARMAFAWEMVVWRRELSFTQIAHLMNFSDSSHLSRAFRSAYGLPPSGFRNPGLLQVIGQPVRYPSSARPGVQRSR